MRGRIMNGRNGVLIPDIKGKSATPCAALCVDSESWNHPELFGLEDECLSAQSWLRVFHDGSVAREALRRDDSFTKAWVVSSDTVEGINLAAAIKHDNAELSVSLVSFEGTGSLMGRCQAAGLELIRSKGEFVKCYVDEKSQQIQDRTKRLAFDRGNVRDLPIEEPARKSSSPVSHTDSEEKDPQGTARLPLVLPSDKQQKERSCDKPKTAHWTREPETQESCNKSERLSLPLNAQESDAFVLAIVGGSGGVGKSTVAASAAALYQCFGRKTLLIDADLQFGDMSYFLGIKQALDIVDLLENPQRVGRLKPENGLPALLAAPKNLEQSEVVAEHIADLIAFLKGQFEIIVINTGAFWSEQHAQIIESVDKVLFLLDQRPSSVRSCSHALDLCSRCGIPTQSFLFVLNFCSRKALLTSFDASCALQGAKVEELKDGGREVGELLGAGLVKELIDIKNPFSESLSDLCMRILPNTVSGNALCEHDEKRPLRKRRILGFRKKKVAACL